MPAGVGSCVRSSQTLRINSARSRGWGGQFCLTSALPTTMGRKQKQRRIHVTYELVANACINAKDDIRPPTAAPRRGCPGYTAS